VKGRVGSWVGCVSSREEKVRLLLVQLIQIDLSNLVRRRAIKTIWGDGDRPVCVDELGLASALSYRSFLLPGTGLCIVLYNTCAIQSRQAKFESALIENDNLPPAALVHSTIRLRAIVTPSAAPN
jgi:hypothetical protein